MQKLYFFLVFNLFADYDSIEILYEMERNETKKKRNCEMVKGGA